MKKILVMSVVFFLMAMTITNAQNYARRIHSEEYVFSFEYHPNYRINLLFPPPDGFDRIDDNKLTDYQKWMTGLPVRPNLYQVECWTDYDTISVGDVSAIVDLGITSPQQTHLNIPLYLRWAFLRSIKKLNQISYILDSDTVTYDQWLSGKFVFNGAGDMIYKPGDTREHSPKDFFRFSEFVMGQNNINHVKSNSKKIPLDNIRPGDLYIQDNKNDTKLLGHAAIVLDVCHGPDDETLLMCAWGGYPPHSFYIPESENKENGPWMTYEEFQSRLPLDLPGEFYRLQR